MGGVYRQEGNSNQKGTTMNATCECGHEFEYTRHDVTGAHVLLCGDSTKKEDVERLMNGAKADMVFTDPPWNVNYGAVEKGNAQGYKPRTILNDYMGTDEFRLFMESAFARMNEASVPGAMTYVVMSAQEWGNMMLALAINDYHWSSTIIWNKDRLVLSRKDYHTKYEPLWYGWKDGESRVCPLEDRKQSDVWDIPRPSSSELHPTTKPVELVERAILNSSRPGSTVLDLFLGSGTTLIACEKTGRTCYGMELDPIYADVIVKRWQEFTGKKAVLFNEKTPAEAAGVGEEQK
jgi:DNA modification methylase